MDFPTPVTESAAIDYIKGFATYDEFKNYINASGAKFVDIGASKGGSRKSVESNLRAEATTNHVKPGCPVVLGLDINDQKLQQCNRNARRECPFCIKSDLRDIVRGHSSSVPLLDGTNMRDILEHINLPLGPEAAAALPYSRMRKVHGKMFDTALHTTAMELWTAACLMSKACFMEGPGFDDEEPLRAIGYVQYYAQWSAHTCHINSTTMAAAVAKLPSSRPAFKLVALSRRIFSSADNRIFRLPPDAKDQGCDSRNPERFSLACDRHKYGSVQDVDPSMSKIFLKYPKDAGEIVDFNNLSVFERLHTMVAFDADRHMSQTTASVLTKLPCKFEVVFCELPGAPTLGNKECAEQLLKLARQTLAGNGSKRSIG